jgi:hypothetical protein
MEVGVNSLIALAHNFMLLICDGRGCSVVYNAQQEGDAPPTALTGLK